MLLRERIEDLSPESLKRFDVRWAIAINRPPSIGDPLTEVHLGSYVIREVPGWDGKFARVEKGSGEVVTTYLDDLRVEIDVTATEPVLVVLGTGYYPRWRATHASGADEPVYAYPGVPNGDLHVVSAWVQPGHTTFTVDGPLPSDGDGHVLTLAAGLACIAIAVVWTRRRWRLRVLRAMARGRARLPGLLRAATPYAVASLLAMMLVRGCVVSARPALYLGVGDGIRATATVEAKVGDGDWETCDYERLAGDFRCDAVIVYDGMATILNDSPPSWAFSTPAIIALPEVANVHIRIHLAARLAGTYWGGVSESDRTELKIDARTHVVTRQNTFDIDDRGSRDITITAALSSAVWRFTFVRADTLNPPRPELAPPP
jgi:hypothetical protein